MMTNYIAFLLPCLALAIAAATLLPCRHPREMFDRFEDGRAALRCERCLRIRPNILVAEPQYKLTQPGGPITLIRTHAAAARQSTGRSTGQSTGIERIWAELDHPITDLELFGVSAR
ncbi:MAG: hypothetical protein ACRD1E_05750 [Terriglobales bacterium]